MYDGPIKLANLPLAGHYASEASLVLYKASKAALLDTNQDAEQSQTQLADTPLWRWLLAASQGFGGLAGVFLWLACLFELSFRAKLLPSFLLWLATLVLLLEQALYWWSWWWWWWW